MDVVFRLISELRLVLVVVAAVCCAAFLFTGFAAWRELRRAVFKLERSTIISNALSAWFKAAICAVIGVAIWVVTDDTTRPSLRPDDNPLAAAPMPTLALDEPTPLPTADLSGLLVAAALPIPSTPEPVFVLTAPPATMPAPPTVPLLPPSTPTPLPPLPTPPPPQVQFSNIVVATATPMPELIPLIPEPSPTPEPAVGEALIADCPSPAARITSPVAGEVVSGIYVVRGTADFPGGVGRYKLEILRPNVPGWAFLWENYNAVRDGVLMPRFDAGLFPPGVYTLRLMLIDGAGQETGIYCSVQIRIP